MSLIHPTAIIADGARLGDAVQVGAYAIIDAHVTLGDRTRVGHHAIVEGHTTIGPNCKIGHHTTLGSAPQDLTYAGEPTRLEIGRNNFFGDFCNVSRASTKEDGVTVIGDDCFLMAYAHVAHDCKLGNGVIMVNAAQMGGHCRVEDGANISGAVAIGQFRRIGCYSICSGGSGINQDVPPYGLVSGVTAWLIGINLIGLKRNGFTPEEIRAIKKAYRIIFKSELTHAEAMSQTRAELGQFERVEHLCQFIETSKLGVSRMRPKRGGAQ